MGSHAFDLFLWLNDDRPVEWVQFHLTRGGDDLAGGRLQQDVRRRRGMSSDRQPAVGVRPVSSSAFSWIAI